MKNVTRTLTTLLAGAFISIVSMQVMALKSDRDQPAEIEADDIEFDFPKGIRTYTKNVLVIQGTLRLKADKLVGIYKDGELVEATAWGSLARFKQRPDDKPEDVEGWAKKIIVDQQANTLTLIGKAALKQGIDTARGDTIIYNMATDKLQIKGGAKLAGGGKAGAKKPKRTIEDPFKDDVQGPEDVPLSATESTKAANNDTVAPTSSGRSRLIIRPKSAKKKEPAKENQSADDKKN